MDATFRKIPAQATAAGNAGGTAFSSGFTKSFGSISGGLGKSMGASLAYGMANAAADVIRGDKQISEAFADTLKGTHPLFAAIGALAESALAGLGFGGKDLDADIKKSRDAALAAAKAEQLRVTHAKDVASIEAKIAMNIASATDNALIVAQARLDAVRAEETFLRENLLSKLSEQERKNAVELSDLRIKLAEQEFAIEQGRQQKRLEEATQEAREQATKDFASFAVGEAQTALGGFKFDAFPPDLQKTIQLRIAKAVEKISGNTETPAGVF